MPYSDLLIDIEKMPENERAALVNIAKAHNALTVRSGNLQTAVDGITGKTPEEKADMARVFSFLHLIIKWVHAKRFNATLFALQGMALAYILKFFNVDGALINRLVEALVKVLEKVAGA